MEPKFEAQKPMNQEVIKTLESIEGQLRTALVNCNFIGGGETGKALDEEFRVLFQKVHDNLKE